MTTPVDMRIFALETNRQKLLDQLLAPNEQILLDTRFHWIRFLPGVLRFVVVSALAAVAVQWYGAIQLPPSTPWIVLLLWLVFGLWPFLNTLIDWTQDAVIVTTEEVAIIDQNTVFRRKIRQMTLENLASVSGETQWGNIFRFGRLIFDLKEGTGEHVRLPYVPHADHVASVISDAIVAFHRREIEETPGP